MTTWSDRVASLEALGWSLTEIGREIGLSVQSVSDLKGGRSTAPRGMAAVKLHRLHADGLPPPRLVQQPVGAGE